MAEPTQSQTLASLKALGSSCRSTTSVRAAHPSAVSEVLPSTRLRVDRAFVDRLGIDQHHSALVGAIVAIADALGLEVTAEGVENQEQFASLNRSGCRREQAFYLAPADPSRHLVAKSYRWQFE